MEFQEYWSGLPFLSSGDLPNPSLFIGFFRHEYWSELPFPPSGDLPNTGIEPGSPALQADSLPSEPSGKPYLSITTTALF